LTPTPVRLRRSRAKGARLVSPNGLPVVCVTRGTKWGNPFYVTSNIGQVVRDQYAVETRAFAVSMFERYLREGKLDFTADDVRRDLAGKNLACWCPPGGPCHADVLLELANAQELTLTRKEA